MKTQTLTDESPMPWGKHKGTKMANVPAAYLLWCLREGKCSADVREYINDNLEILKREAGGY